MVSVDKQALISQLCTASKLQGKDLEEYRARLNKMSETELSALISGDNKGENVDTVELNHSQGVNKTEITKKDAEDSAIQTIESNANQAIQMIDSQDDGNISEAYNKLKEKFDSDLAKSNVEKIVYKQLETAYFLKEAQANNLTYKEYFEQRKELLYKTFPGIERFNDKQKQSLKRMIDSLSPEQVLEQQDKILSLPEAGTEGYDDSVRSFLNDFKTETTDSVIVQNKEFGMKVKTQPKSKFELADGERLMPFDEVYYLEQGVKFNKDNIQKYNESAAQFAFVNSVNQKREEVHKILEEPLKLVKGNNALGANPDVINSSNKQLNTAVYSALAKLYGNDEGKIKQGLKELTGENYSFKNGELVLEDSKFKFNTDTILPNIAQTILDKIDSNYEKMTNGKSLEDYANQMAEDYKSAYGSKDATNLASAYVQDQEGMVQNIRTGVELVGAGVMVAGMIFFPPAALAGGAVAGFGGAGVELYNESTRDNVNTERTGELKKELVINSLLMVVGMGAGKAGSAMKAVLTAKNAPKLAAIAGDIGTDATISLLGDLALTGQVNIEGEGFAQFLSLVAGHKGKIVSGIKHVKDNIKAKFGPDARQMPDGTIYKVNQDGSTTVLRDVVENPGVNDGAGISHTTTDTPAGQSDLAARLDNAQSREDFTAIRDEIKNMPNSPQKAELQKQYLQKWNEFSQNPARHEIKMEYKPEDDVPSFKTNEELTEFLKNEKIKDADGNEVPRFYDDEIQYMMNGVETQEERDILGFLTGLKDGNKPRFDIDDIANLTYAAQTQEGRDAIEYFAGFKDGDKPRFDGGEISYLVESAQTKENREMIEYLASLKDGNKPRFDGAEIGAFVKRAHSSEDRDFIKYLVELKDGDKPRFDGEELNYLLLQAKTQADRDAIEFLVCLKDGDNPRFGGKDIINLADNAHTQEGRDAIEFLAGLKDGDNPRFNEIDIYNLSNRVQSKEDRDAIEYLAGIKDGDKPRFNGTDIANLVESAQTQEGRDAIEFLAGFKDGDKPRFNVGDIARLAGAAKTPDNQKFIQKLVDEKENDILNVLNEQNIKLAEDLCNRPDFPKEHIADIVQATREQNIKLAEKLVKQIAEKEITPEQCLLLLKNYETISYKDIQKLRQTIGRDRVYRMNSTDLLVAAQFPSLAGKQNINEIPIEEKRGLLRNLVKCNTGLFEISDDLAKDFPLIPRNQDQYCTLLPAIVRSLGVDVTPLKPETKVENFNNSMSNLSQSLAKLSDTDFANITITQEYSKDDFIKTVLSKVKDLSRVERQKVYDYYGFELHHNKGNKSTGFSITGYPVNLNNGKKLAQITDPKTKEVVENLRQDVIRFSENNRIKSNNPQVEQFLNEIIDALPELRTTIGKTQHSTHDFDIMQHSLKVMQKVTQDPKFNELNESDKKIMMLASLMHDIRKAEGYSDPTHADESSFDTFFIAKKFSLSKDEEIKLYTLIKHHEWLQYVNTARDKDGNIIPEKLEKRLQSVAYDLQQDNLFDMTMMFTHADLKAVKSDNTFHDTTLGKGRVDEAGKPISYGDLADNYAQRIKKYVTELQKSQPLLPVTKIPTSSVMKQAITQVNPDGSTNLKGVYLDNDGLVVLKYNEVEDWESLGFPEGSVSKGISAKGLNNRGQKTDVDTGNIKFFVHALDYANQLAKFDAFSLVDSDVLLSVSYAERPESKYRFFRTQGVLLDVDTKYVHGGGNTDSGSGYGKSIDDFKNRYIFGGERESDRLYISNMIKEATGMNDDEYVRFVKENENKPFTEIEPADLREKIIKAFATINSNVRKGNREYNEMYASNPNVMGVFVYSPDDNVGNVLEFVENNLSRLDFLKKFALERDIPMIVFGD